MLALKLIQLSDISIKAADQTRQQMERRHSHSGHKRKNTQHIQHLQIQAKKKCYYATGTKMSPHPSIIHQAKAKSTLIFMHFSLHIFNSESCIISHTEPSVTRSGETDLTLFRSIRSSSNAQLCALKARQ